MLVVYMIVYDSLEITHEATAWEPLICISEI